MSFSGGSGRSGSGKSSFGKKGFSSSQKKERKKKQEFHRHKMKLSDEREVGLGELKERVSVSLEKLGHQVFSQEPGGYGFENWMASFNLLLDDFEEKAGSQNLPKEYYDARQRVSAELGKSIDTSEFDKEISTLEAEMESTRQQISELAERTRAKFDEERKTTAARIRDLKEEEVKSSAEIDSAKEGYVRGGKRKTVERTTKQSQQSSGSSSSSFFGRFFSRSKTGSASESEARRIQTMTARREEIRGELRELEAKEKEEDSARHESEKEVEKLRENLKALQNRVGEVESRKLSAMQLTEKRIEVAAEMSRAISSIQLAPEAENGEPAHSESPAS